MSKAIGIIVDGVPEWHAPPTGVADYHTLCGMDANDPYIGHEGVIDAKRGQKITCAQCFMIWKRTVEMRLRERNFDTSVVKDQS